ncbi:amino acid adenylation domain-containing protein [Nocardiopsis sp. ARC36]
MDVPREVNGDLLRAVEAAAVELRTGVGEVLAAAFLVVLSREGARAPESFEIRSEPDGAGRSFGPVGGAERFAGVVAAVAGPAGPGGDVRCTARRAADRDRAEAPETAMRVERTGGLLRVHWTGSAPGDGTPEDGAGDLRALAERHLCLLASALASPRTRVRDLRVLPPEQEAVLASLSGTPDRFPVEAPVHELFERRAGSHPDALAIERSGERLTYRQLNARANQLARVLRTHGAEPETTVALLMERSTEMLVAFLAVFKSGAAAVLLDPGHPAKRLERTIADARPRALLTLGRLAAVPQGLDTTVILVDDEWDRIGSQPSGDLGVPVHPEGIAYVVHTSGSTGEPKRVAVLHRSVAHSVRTHQEGHRITPQDRAAWLAPPGASVSVGELWPYLTAGASVHPAEREAASSAEALRDWIVRERVTTAFVSMPLAEHLYTLPWPRTAALRLLTVGSDKVRRWASPELPFEVAVAYGSSEANGISSCLVPWSDRLTSATAGPSDLGTAPPVGRPWSGVRLRLLDPVMRPVPPGAVGELYVGGPELARGYLGASALTAERFVPDPDGPAGARLYRTGDLARFDSDGRLHHYGRVDHETKVRGFRVHPAEAEAALLEHPAVQAAVVVPVVHPSGSTQLAAYLVGRPGLDVGEVRAHAGERLPEHLAPAAYTVLPVLPTTVNGKVDRSALPQVSWGEEPDGHEPPAMSSSATSWKSTPRSSTSTGSGSGTTSSTSEGTPSPRPG